MIGFVEMLSQRTHRDLELIARAHHLPFTRREPKARGLAALTAALQAGAYQKAFKTLTPAHIAALQALVAAGGWLPLPLFTAHFGQIRPYKPWRADFKPRHPWRYPASTAERLYHLGFITLRDGEMVGIIEEVQALLPPLPQAEAITPAVPVAAPGRLALLRDLAALLGTLLLVDAAPVHGRWLAVSVLRQLNERLQSPEDLRDVRSETQACRLRWLHYVALVGGLVSVQGGLLKPTVAAWRWLAEPPQAQWDTLMRAIEADLVAYQRQWDVFRFPDITVYTWRKLRHTLDNLSPARAYRVKDVFALLQPYLLPENRYTLGSALREVFAWSGMVLLARGRLLIPPHFPTAVTLVEAKSELQIPLPSAPSAALVTLLSFAPVSNGSAFVNAEAVTAAVKQGLTAADIAQVINTLTGKPLSIQAQQQLQAWEQAASQLVLKPMLVLHASDADTLRQIRADWRLNGHFAGRLSPHDLAVVADDACVLGRRHRRDLVE